MTHSRDLVIISAGQAHTGILNIKRPALLVKVHVQILLSYAHLDHPECKLIILQFCSWKAFETFHTPQKSFSVVPGELLETGWDNDKWREILFEWREKNGFWINDEIDNALTKMTLRKK